MREHRLRALRGLAALAVVAGGFVAAAPGGAATVPVSFRPAAARAHVMPRSGSPRAQSSTVGTLSTPNLTWYGGKVMPRVKIVEVVWGAGTYAAEVTGNTAPNFPSFFAGVTNSSYFDWLSEYSANGMVIGRGSYAGRYTITPTHSLDDTGIQADLVDAITAQDLPAPDANTLYFLMFPQGSVITMGGSDNLTGFCAYHGTIEGLNGAPNIRYAVLPDSAGDSPGCGPSAGFGNMTGVASHELVEAVTDPDVGLATGDAPPLSWYDNQNGEIADICNADQATVTGGDSRTYTVQTLWSNQQGACIVQGNPRLISVGGGTILEGDAGKHTVRLPVTLSAPSTRPVTVSYTVHGVTAYGATSFHTGVDVASTFPTTVSFSVGTSGVTPVLKWITITVYGDPSVESNEIFKVWLSNASPGYGIGHSWQYVTIINDDVHANRTVGVGDASVVVGASGTRQINFPVTISRAVSVPVTAHFAATGISAVAGTDFGKLSGTVTIPANATTAFVVLNVFAKPNAVSNKTLRLTLSSLHGPSGTQLVRANATGTLLAH